MDNAIEQLAEAICYTNPVTVEGRALDWEEIVRLRPDRAVEYREAASNRIRAEEAMRQLDRRSETHDWNIHIQEDR